MVYKKKSALFMLLLGILLVITVLLASFNENPFSEYKIDSHEDVSAFLSELGWECEIQEISEQASVLPEQFDTVLSDYNTLQLRQGCDLTKYAGQEIIIYTVPILNYSNSAENIYATIMVHKGRIIGGDIHSADLNGFMHTLC